MSVSRTLLLFRGQRKSPHVVSDVHRSEISLSPNLNYDHHTWPRGNIHPHHRYSFTSDTLLSVCFKLFMHFELECDECGLHSVLLMGGLEPT